MCCKDILMDYTVAEKNDQMFTIISKGNKLLKITSYTQICPKYTQLVLSSERSIEFLIDKVVKLLSVLIFVFKSPYPTPYMFTCIDLYNVTLLTNPTHDLCRLS